MALLILLSLVFVEQEIQADSVVIDFQSLRREDADTVFLIGPVYEEDGMVLEATHPSPEANPPNSSVLGTQSPAFTGSTMLYHWRSLGQITLSSETGSFFTLSA